MVSFALITRIYPSPWSVPVLIRWLILCLPALFGLCLPLQAGESAPVKDADALAARIDKALADRWTANKVTPAAPADDAELLRRLSLDLNGVIPSVSEARAFLDDPSSDKKRRLVDRLLDNPAYVAHFTDVWRDAWLPDGGPNVDNVGLRNLFEAWLRTRLAENATYDRMIREILTTEQQPARENPASARMTLAPSGLSPISFTLALENKPESLAGNTSRLFLGVRLECAQCHDHPFADWTREQFWQYTAFFKPNRPGVVPELNIPGTPKTVKGAFPDGTGPDLKKNPAPRVALADWATSPKNPYFAKAAVNRVWAGLFGVGLAEPVDDLVREGKDNPLLDELAEAFEASQFDVKFLIRAIVLTKAYQLSSVSSHPSQDEPKMFARMPSRSLSTEQIVASLIEATGYRDVNGRRGGVLLRAELNGAFAKQPGKPTEFQTSIPQALALMNGKFVADATSLERSGTLAAVAASPFLDAGARVETLYLAALGRKPTPAEAAKLTKYVEKGGPTGDSDKALADVFWALLNSSEFSLNH